MNREEVEDKLSIELESLGFKICIKIIKKNIQENKVLKE